MSKTEILAELPKLSTAELAEVQAKLDELVGEQWDDRAGLNDDERSQLDAAIADYHNDPNAGAAWDEVRARIEGKLRA
jgi:hypothetical protein